ncbi:MAG: BrnA antitoxin family protein [Rhodobacteraceae bacterium]|nr:BrnA antitoxin family protein [Paracoccaceae bacterium]MBR9821261.1 BrnA antitoxin family protein [Paracoccaceae bacterium]
MKEELITRVSLEELRKSEGKTDWNRLRETERKGEEPAHDPDIDGDDWDLDNATAMAGIFAGVDLPEPEPKKAISLRVDNDVLEFFKSQGKGYQTRINAVLRAYMDAKKAG